MTDFFLQFGISNLCISMALALVAYAVHRSGKLPFVAHLLWVLVLLKLITPPLLTLPVIPVPGLDAGAVETRSGLSAVEPTAVGTLTSEPGVLGTALDDTALETGRTTPGAWSLERTKTSLLALWALGSAGVFAWSLLRIVRFNRLLHLASEPAPPEVRQLTAGLARRLGLRLTPIVCTTSAQVSPMVWWVGGRPRIVLPIAISQEIEADDLRWILGHELAHVKRRDHLVRWLEWLACVAFWWNPVAWWARRNLRINEEICCDALVLSSLQPKPHVYANALMTVVEFLASPALRPPAMASEINSGGVLERRFRMIVSTHRPARTPRWLTAGALALTLGLMPLGIAYGQDYDAVGKRLREAVAAGELTAEQARTMMQSLRSSGEHEEGERDAGLRRHYATAEKRLKAMVEAGKISAEDARKRLQGLRRSLAERDEQAERDDAVRRRLEAAGEELRRAVAEGRLSEEEARAKFEAMRKKMADTAARESDRASDRVTDRAPDRNDGLRRRFEAAAKEIRIAIKEGRITEAQGRKKLEALRQRMAEHAKQAEPEEARLSREQYAEAEAKLKKLVEEGMLTEQAATERLAAMRKQMSGGKAGLTREEYAAIAERLDLMVEQGLISKEEARQKLVELRQAMADNREGDQGDGLQRRIAVALSEAGIEREVIREVMGAMPRIVAKLKEEGEDFELNSRMLNYLKELGLDSEQIELVVGLARRLAYLEREEVRESGR